ncbi:MAG: 6-phosphogluconolactonase [Candidatus Microbacterium phytovorans]|uniref:6-phosphogluconolactonase n=1 Tax=Candidatus Microbacterium phytovorans TaxID=3121374 RepID=A0AAJ6B4D0_9MICO|nr:6-phosphogluconolactonase [Microbacterium sp.]WEK14212.1 MAG: 6-phosphogluconolactonase [Microbacterium sp.]
MAVFSTEKRVVISADAGSLAAAVARRFLDRLVRRGAAGKTSHVALTGGHIGTDVLRAAGADPRREDVDWTRVHFWWGDERFVPRDDEERNERAARQALLDHIAVPPENVHAMASSEDGLDLDAAAQAYADELARFGTDDQAWPTFWVCFLGVGPDGHIASLFPDRAEIQVTDRSVVAVRDSPKPPADRITLTRPVINSSRCVWMVLSGVDKAAALGLALAGASYDSVPAAGAKGQKRTMLFVDEAAAQHVPPELIDPEF